MANLTIDDNQFKYSHNTTQAGTHNITLNTENKFVDKDIVLSITTTAAQTAADTATATITVDTATGTNANNVRGIISATSTRPTENTAYYLSFIASLIALSILLPVSLFNIFLAILGSIL